MKSAKAKRILLSAVSMMLVATMAVAGTVAYLQDSSEDVVNTFSTNNVNVELEESGNGGYNIIPGTSETKDPTVTVNASLPAYVYVEVTDETQDLVTWEIADGWTKLDGYDNVYYREFTPAEENDNTATYSVLKGDQVSYSASLTNEDMEKVTGDIQLTFKAYAIQKEPFGMDAEGNQIDGGEVSAYLAASTDVAADTYRIATADTLADVLTEAEDGDVIIYYGETVYDDSVTINKSVTVYNLNSSAQVTVSADDVALNNVKITVSGAGTPAVIVGADVTDFTMTGSEISADTGSSGTHTAVNIAAGGDIIFVDNTITNPSYNGVEFSQNTEVKSLTISNNTFINCGNNAVSIYKIQEGAEINIENNVFSNVSNAIRLSDYSNKKATFNIFNNTADTDNMWNYVLVLLQAVKGEDFSNYTLNFKGNTVGEKCVYTYVYGSTTAPVVNHLD